LGKEIEQTTFSAEQTAQFVERLKQETETLDRWRAEGGLSETGYVGGFELEAWLLDHNFFPLPRNEEYLKRLDYPLVVPEIRWWCRSCRDSMSN
jgi:hypothetical protein